MKKSIIFISVFLGMAALPASIFAQEMTELVNAINTVWVLVAAFLVFFMQAGFAAVEIGFTRAKNSSNILMKNLLDFAAGSVSFFLVGYGLAYGADALGGFVGISNFLAQSSPVAGLSPATFFLFQVVFAATAATIVSGAVAERTKFIGYIFYTIFITSIIYPVVVHWIWGGGWLSKMGFIDFAGSTAVHSVGGWAALAGAVIVGSRTGKYNKDGSANAIPGHNIPLAGIGVFILWFGWFGFNPGSSLAAVGAPIGTIAVTTNLSAAAGTLAALMTSWLKYRKPDVSMTLNGALAGLVAITAGCAAVSPVSALIIGAVAGFIVIFAIELFEKFHVDDPVGAISVHAICGAFGTLATGLFAQEAFAGPGINGLFFGGGLSQLWVQAAGVLAVLIWTMILSVLVFLAVKHTVGLRADDEEQSEGMDLGEHDLAAYPDFQRTVIKSYHLREM